MSLNFDAGAFVVSKELTTSSTALTTSNGSVNLIASTPCDLDISGFAVTATTAAAGPVSFNIKVTPPTVAPVYARTYNYNYATAKNYQISSVVTDGTTLTFTTSTAHNLSANDVVTINGLSFAPYNLKDATLATASGVSFTIKYPEPVNTAIHLTGSLNGAYANFSQSGSVATYNSTTIPHGLKTGDKVTIAGLTSATGYHVTAAAITVTGAYSFTYAVSSGGTFSGSGTATVYATIVAPTDTASTKPVVTKGQVVDAVQLVTDNTDYNKAADYTAGTSYYAYTSDQILGASSKGALFPAATNLGNADSRVSGRIPAGSRIDFETLVTDSTIRVVSLGVEFKKK